MTARPKRYSFPKETQGRTRWTWLHEQLDQRFGASPSPAPDLDPAGAAAERSRPLTAKTVLGWGTERYIRHWSEREGRVINARPFAGSPWADSEGIRQELTHVGERAWRLYGHRGDVRHRRGTPESIRRIKALAGHHSVTWFRDARSGDLHIFYCNGRPGLTASTLAVRLRDALLGLPGQWPYEPDADADWKPDADKVSAPYDPARIEAAKAHMKRKRHKVAERSRAAFTVTCRDGASDEEWDRDWETYKAIVLTRDEERAPPLFAAA